MAAIHEYVHHVPSLEVYPRAYYYCRRLNDVLRKFNRFIDKYQSILPEDYKRSVPERNTLESGVTVKVIGRCDLGPEEFLDTKSNLYRVVRPANQSHSDYIVANDPYKDKLERPSSPSKESLKPMECDVTADITQDEAEHVRIPETTIIVCYADIEKLDENGLKEIDDLASHISKHADIQPQNQVLVVKQFSKPAEEPLLRTLKLGIFNHVVIRKEVGKNITQILISDLSEKFSAIASDLHVCVNSERAQFRSQGNPFKMVEPQLKDFILHSLEYPDITETSVEGEDELQTILRRISRLIRCALVYPISCKYNIPISVCNSFFIESDFEQSLTKKISKETKESLEKEYNIRKKSSQNVPTETRQNVAIENSMKASLACCDSLQRDLDDVVTDTCRKLNNLASAVRKMRLEISACQRKINPMRSELMTHPASKAVNDVLREHILSTEDVYGVGNIYDQVEIHVVNNDVVKKVEDRVAKLFRKENISCPFTVRAIARTPTMFADYQYEHGTEVESTIGRGTLGGFLYGDDDHLYCITCAHVVGGMGQTDLLIQDPTRNQKIPFARTVPNMIISTGNPSKPLIDLAAVRVLHHLRHRCMKFLKDDEGKIRRGILSADSPLGLHVYKHGAGSNLTKGIVCSDDYSILSAEHLTYIMLIDNYDDDDRPFAQRGDSGSIICKSDENFVYTIKAVGVLSAGEFKPEGQDTPLCFSFRLQDGLAELSRIAGVRFHFPEDY